MKVSGKNPRLFIGDREIEGCLSFSLSSGDSLKDSFLETVVFEGVYAPDNETKLEDFKNIAAKIGNVILVIITSFDGEKREAKVRIAYKNGVISLEPVDEDIQEWVKGWIRKKGSKE